MSAFSAINLSALAAPEFTSDLDFEAVLAEIKADLLSRAPDLAPVLELESEPLVKLLESLAYRVLGQLSRINHAGRACMLATAIGADLDNLAANMGVVRLNDETDERLRERTALAPEGFSVAGPAGAYVFHVLSAHSDIADVAVDSPAPGQVRLVILSTTGDGGASAELIAAVVAAVNAEDVRPLTDQVAVQSAAIVAYDIDAELQVAPGPDMETVRLAALAEVQAYAASRRRIGRDIKLSGIYAALHQPGVESVTLTLPVADIAVTSLQAATATTLAVGAINV
jgi:phage-related baseplate assembly protein